MNVEKNQIDNIEIINDDCRNINIKGDVILLGYIGNTIEFLEKASNWLKLDGTIIFHEVYRNNWLGFKKRSDWKGVTIKFSQLMEDKGFKVNKFNRIKFYGPSTSHVVASLSKI